MTETVTLWLCILVGAIGLAFLAGVILFGFQLWGSLRRRLPSLESLLHELLHDRMMRDPHPQVPARYISEVYSEYLQRRNEFWTGYGQVAIATLIIVLLSVLLLTKSISAEAGLPILSGISGFAIAKGVSVSRSGSTPDDRERPQ